ncbi:hypothetical protein Pst134EB_020289 [Puccinia striiformis f. sp. tritici]|nr:hypothetical protein Pst134EB_020289 [Puccinia striiformis f. sp. tritici]
MPTLQSRLHPSLLTRSSSHSSHQPSSSSSSSLTPLTTLDHRSSLINITSTTQLDLLLFFHFFLSSFFPSSFPILIHLCTSLLSFCLSCPINSFSIAPNT